MSIRKIYGLILVSIKNPSFLWKGLFHTTPGESFLAQVSWNDIHEGMTQLLVDMYLVLIIGGNWYYFSKGYLISFSLIIYFIQNMLMSSFQCHSKSSFCGPNKVSLSYVPTQRPQKLKNIKLSLQLNFSFNGCMTQYVHITYISK